MSGLAGVGSPMVQARHAKRLHRRQADQAKHSPSSEHHSQSKDSTKEHGETSSSSSRKPRQTSTSSTSKAHATTSSNRDQQPTASSSSSSSSRSHHASASSTDTAAPTATPSFYPEAPSPSSADPSSTALPASIGPHSGTSSSTQAAVLSVCGAILLLATVLGLLRRRYEKKRERTRAQTKARISHGSGSTQITYIDHGSYGGGSEKAAEGGGAPLSSYFVSYPERLERKDSTSSLLSQFYTAPLQRQRTQSEAGRPQYPPPVRSNSTAPSRYSRRPQMPPPVGAARARRGSSDTTISAISVSDVYSHRSSFESSHKGAALIGRSPSYKDHRNAVSRYGGGNIGGGSVAVGVGGGHDGPRSFDPITPPGFYSSFHGSSDARWQQSYPDSPAATQYQGYADPRYPPSPEAPQHLRVHQPGPTAQQQMMLAQLARSHSRATTMSMYSYESTHDDFYHSRGNSCGVANLATYNIRRAPSPGF
ncbi:hypothetical protein ACQY0O_001276 [Thecaphora frezii]